MPKLWAACVTSPVARPGATGTRTATDGWWAGSAPKAARARAGSVAAAGKAREWRSKLLPRYRNPTKSEQDQTTAAGVVFRANEALIASVYLSGTTTRQVRRGLVARLE